MTVILLTSDREKAVCFFALMATNDKRRKLL